MKKKSENIVQTSFVLNVVNADKEKYNSGVKMITYKELRELEKLEKQEKKSNLDDN